MRRTGNCKISVIEIVGSESSVSEVVEKPLLSRNHAMVIRFRGPRLRWLLQKYSSQDRGRLQGIFENKGGSSCNCRKSY